MERETHLKRCNQRATGPSYAPEFGVTCALHEPWGGSVGSSAGLSVSTWEVRLCVFTLVTQACPEGGRHDLCPCVVPNWPSSVYAFTEAQWFTLFPKEITVFLHFPLADFSPYPGYWYISPRKKEIPSVKGNTFYLSVS